MTKEIQSPNVEESSGVQWPVRHTDFVIRHSDLWDCGSWRDLGGGWCLAGRLSCCFCPRGGEHRGRFRLQQLRREWALRPFYVWLESIHDFTHRPEPLERRQFLDVHGCADVANTCGPAQPVHEQGNEQCPCHPNRKSAPTTVGNHSQRSENNRGENEDDVQNLAPLRSARDDRLNVAEIKSFVFLGKKGRSRQQQMVRPQPQPAVTEQTGIPAGQSPVHFFGTRHDSTVQYRPNTDSPPCHLSQGQDHCEYQPDSGPMDHASWRPPVADGNEEGRRRRDQCERPE